ncbi:tetratricopeptide repeat protein [Desulfuromonas carbonis]|uniref:tetratricopeptide repeat protein n=1 Tax=Desulfuromonas sp. DDH964 TaxID=1823759 RepID=UPI00078C8E7F|nr:tetratricopeptide repeat protein [Desulfuromonas sp. DDH964]AMV71965.1 lipoprotein [Desulfuromonas sp. DDH964]
MLIRFFCLTLCSSLLFIGGCSLSKKEAQQADIHYVLGLSSLREQNPTMAMRELLQAVAIAPERADIHDALGQAYYLKKAYPEAEAQFLKAVELAPEDAQYENNLAALYLDLQRWDDAARHFLHAARNLFFATPEVAFTGAGFANFQKGNYVDAIRLYREALDHNPRYAQAFVYLGETYYAMDKTELAVAEYTRALEINPDYTEANYRLGLAYLKLRQPEKAEKSFRTVLRLAPDSDLARQSRDYLKLLP